MAKTPSPAPGAGELAGSDADDQPGIEGHNINARESSLLFHVQQFRESRAKIAELMVPLKNAQKVFTTRRNAASQAGWTLEILDKALKREEQGNRRQQSKQAEEEAFVMRMLGLPFGNSDEQMDMFADADQDTKDEFFWGQHGYSQGLRGLPAKAPPDMPTQFLQAWLKRHAAGAERLAWAASEQGHSPERPPSEAERAKAQSGDADKTHNPKDPLLS